MNTSKIQFIPMIDHKSPDVQNGPRDVASHVKDIIEGIDMLSVSDSAKAIPKGYREPCQGVVFVSLFVFPKRISEWLGRTSSWGPAL